MRLLLLPYSFGLFSLIASAETPYVVQFQVRTFAAGVASPSRVVTELEARRSDGSSARRSRVTMPDGTVLEQVEIVDLARRQIVRTDPATGSKTTSQLSAAGTMLHKAAADGCKYLDLAGATADMQSTRLGKQVVLTFDSQNTPQWVAPELNCVALDASFAASDGSHHERIAVNLDAVEPSEELFRVPEGLVERTTAEVDAANRSR